MKARPGFHLSRYAAIAVLCLSGFAWGALSAFAGDVTPPTITTQSPTGIDLATGTSTYKKEDLVIGSLTLERFYRYNFGVGARDPDTMFYGPHWSNNFDIFVTIDIFTSKEKEADGNESNPVPLVHIGDSATGKYFQNGWGSDVSVTTDSTAAESGILNYVYAGGYYTYTDQSDVVYRFNPNVHVQGDVPVVAWQSYTQRVASITRPDGYVKTFNYNSSGWLINVTDSNGDAIVFDYNSSGQITDACGYDLSSTTVTSATTCAGATLKVSYGYTNGYLTSATDVLGNTETYGDYGYVGCITPPGYSTCKVSYSYGGTYQGTQYQLVQTMADGGVWTFSWSPMATSPIDTGYAFVARNSDNPTSFTDPLGNKTKVVFTGATPMSMTDPLGRTTTYTFTGNPDYNVTIQSPPLQDGSNLSTVTLPEGNQYQQSVFGPYNTVTVKTLVAKPGSGLANIVENLKYNCLNMAPACTKPISITDANGNETDYTYDPTHGGMLTETSPADSSGVRPQTRYTYALLYPQVWNGSTLVNGTPQYKLTRTSSCQSATAANPAACVGTAAETVTTYTYGDAHLDMTAKTVAAGDNSVSATTSYTYDTYGNVTVVDGPRTDVDDRSYTTYDLAHRKVFEIGVDPDGTGPLPRVIVHHLYDADGREYRTEVGTGNATDGSDFAMTSHKLITYDAMDRVIETQVLMP